MPLAAKPEGSRLNYTWKAVQGCHRTDSRMPIPCPSQQIRSGEETHVRMFS